MSRKREFLANLRYLLVVDSGFDFGVCINKIIVEKNCLF